MHAATLVESNSAHEDARRDITLRLVLLVGRDPPIDVAARAAMQRKGMRCIALPNLQEAVAASRAAQLDAVVVDSAELRLGAAPLLVQLQRPAQHCPVIVIGRPGSESGELDELDELAALSCGASAYLVGPVAAERLLAHLRAQLRLSIRPATAALPPSARPTVPGNWRLDMARRCLHRPGRLVKLTDVQLALLRCLFDAGHGIVSRGQLGDALEARREIEGRTVDVYIHRLRRHLADQRVTEFEIHAVRRQGYRLVAAPEVAADAMAGRPGSGYLALRTSST